MIIDGQIFEVTVTEYDDGAQRLFEKVKYTNREEANQHCTKINGENYSQEWFLRADMRVI